MGIARQLVCWNRFLVVVELSAQRGLRATLFHLELAGERRAWTKVASVVGEYFSEYADISVWKKAEPDPVVKIVAAESVLTERGLFKQCVLVISDSRFRERCAGEEDSEEVDLGIVLALNFQFCEIETIGFVTLCADAGETYILDGPVVIQASSECFCVYSQETETDRGFIKDKVFPQVNGETLTDLSLFCVKHVLSSSTGDFILFCFTGLELSKGCKELYLCLYEPCDSDKSHSTVHSWLSSQMTDSISCIALAVEEIDTVKGKSLDAILAEIQLEAKIIVGMTQGSSFVFSAKNSWVVGPPFLEDSAEVLRFPVVKCIPVKENEKLKNSEENWLRFFALLDSGNVVLVSGDTCRTVQTGLFSHIFCDSFGTNGEVSVLLIDKEVFSSANSDHFEWGSSWVEQYPFHHFVKFVHVPQKVETLDDFAFFSRQSNAFKQIRSSLKLRYSQGIRELKRAEHILKIKKELLENAIRALLCRNSGGASRCTCKRNTFAWYYLFNNCKDASSHYVKEKEAMIHPLQVEVGGTKDNLKLKVVIVCKGKNVFLSHLLMISRESVPLSWLVESNLPAKLTKGGTFSILCRASLGYHEIKKLCPGSSFAVWLLYGEENDCTDCRTMRVKICFITWEKGRWGCKEHDELASHFSLTPSFSVECSSVEDIAFLGKTIDIFIISKEAMVTFSNRMKHVFGFVESGSLAGADGAGIQRFFLIRESMQILIYIQRINSEVIKMNVTSAVLPHIELFLAMLYSEILQESSYLEGYCDSLSLTQKKTVQKHLYVQEMYDFISIAYDEVKHVMKLCEKVVTYKEKNSKAPSKQKTKPT